MENKARYSLISTIINLVYEAITIVFSVICLLCINAASNNLPGWFENFIGEASTHETSGGYEILGGLLLGGLGIIAIAVFIVYLIIFIILALCVTPTVIVGFVSRHKYMSGQPMDFKADSIVKIAIDGILAVILIVCLHLSPASCIIAILAPVAVIALSVVSLCKK